MEYRNVSKKHHGSPKFGSSVDWSDYAPERSSPERSSNEVNATPTCSKQQPQRHRQHTMTSTKLKTISREHPNNLINKIKNIYSLDELRRLIAEQWASLKNYVNSKGTYPNYHAVLVKNPKKFSTYVEDHKHTDNIISSENNLQQNLLHICCKHNINKLIRRLAGLGCDLAKQDFKGQMPINLALNANNVKCIKEFLQLMRQVKNPEIIEKCKGMFNVRNKDGNTILTIVWQQKRDVFKEFSIFCIRFDVNLNDEERNLLQRGNSHSTYKGSQKYLHIFHISQFCYHIFLSLVYLIIENHNRKNYTFILIFSEFVSKIDHMYLIIENHYRKNYTFIVIFSEFV
uniref:Uncharacterized protein n=1 Tax=Stomoxys calcitrans TaxID=35570 RepID=A0A1I8PDD3_STOCA